MNYIFSTDFMLCGSFFFMWSLYFDKRYAPQRFHHSKTQRFLFLSCRRIVFQNKEIVRGVSKVWQCKCGSISKSNNIMCWVDLLWTFKNFKLLVELLIIVSRSVTYINCSKNVWWWSIEFASIHLSKCYFSE